MINREAYKSYLVVSAELLTIKKRMNELKEEYYYASIIGDESYKENAMNQTEILMAVMMEKVKIATHYEKLMKGEKEDNVIEGNFK